MNSLSKFVLTLVLLIGVQFAFADSWQCRNDLEIQCSDGQCEASLKGEFTSMDVNFDVLGATSVCAYSGCWEGTSDVLKTSNFLVLIGHDLVLSTVQDTEEIGESGQSMTLSLDKNDGIAVLKFGSFAQPLHCEAL